MDALAPTVVVDVTRHGIGFLGLPGSWLRTDVTDIVDSIDGANTRIWTQVVDEACAWAGPVSAMVVAVPSGWGARRASPVLRAADYLGCRTLVVPRAVAVARSHLGAAAQRCCVVELATVSGNGVAPDGTAVHRLVRSAAGWVIDLTVVCDTSDQIVDALDPDSEAVFVDGPDAAAVARALGSGCGPVSGVDPALFADCVQAPAPEVSPPQMDWGVGVGRATSRWRVAASSGRRWAVAAAVMAVLAVVVGLVIAGRTPDAATGSVALDLGRIRVAAPVGWERTDDSASRTTFTHRADGRRIAVVQNALRDNVGVATVAASLQQRIAARGDSAVREFSGEGVYAGRQVITYREAPVSGGAIHWYVVVERALQVSIGCQTGDGGESVERECHDAVASLMIR